MTSCLRKDEVLVNAYQDSLRVHNIKLDRLKVYKYHNIIFA